MKNPYLSCVDLTTHKVKIGYRNSKKAMIVGGNEPLRVVAPFGISNQADRGRDFTHYIEELTKCGVDAVQEVSILGPFKETREKISKNHPIPYGTVLAYEFHSRCEAERRSLTEDRIKSHLFETIESQILSGVDYITIHASVSRSLLSEVEARLPQRAIPMPSRAGFMINSLMVSAGIDNPFLTYFDDIVRALAENDVAISLGSSFRPAAIHDAMDYIHMREISHQAQLCKRARLHTPNLLLEGLSHALPQDMQRFVEHAHSECPDVPLTALGPLPVDTSAGMDHVAASVGAFCARLLGISLVNVVTRAEHLCLPLLSDLLEGVRAVKIASYICDIMRTGKSSTRDLSMSQARSDLRWSEQLQHALFPELMRELTENIDGKPCNICNQTCPHQFSIAKG